jgi:hypothetical protein
MVVVIYIKDINIQEFDFNREHMFDFIPHPGVHNIGIGADCRQLEVKV